MCGGNAVMLGGEAGAQQDLVAEQGQMRRTPACLEDCRPPQLPIIHYGAKCHP